MSGFDSTRLTEDLIEAMVPEKNIHTLTSSEWTQYSQALEKVRDEIFDQIEEEVISSYRDEIADDAKAEMIESGEWMDKETLSGNIDRALDDAIFRIKLDLSGKVIGPKILKAIEGELRENFQEVAEA